MEHLNQSNQWGTTKTTIHSPNGKKLKFAVFYDVHLGHHRTLASSIIKGFEPILRNHEELSTWDILAIPGDLFDRGLLLTDTELNAIMSFFSQLLKVCSRHDITVLILEGTPGHDRKQSALFQYIHQAVAIHNGLPVDVRYVQTLSIEYLKKYDINVLFVPDEWNTDVVDTYNEAVHLLHQKGLTQVDFCLFHGAFNYQIDASLNPKAHNEELWSSLVKYYIFAGHVHFRSQYKNIIVGGSFDRLAHGEEEEKGWVTCEILPSGEHQILFHPNPNATKYVTIDVRGKEVNEIFNLLDHRLSQLPIYSHIRLFTYSRDMINDAMKQIRVSYPLMYFTVKVDNKEKKQRTLEIVPQKFQSIELNKDNLARIVEERLQTVPNIDIQKAMALLNKF